MAQGQAALLYVLYTVPAPYAYSLAGDTNTVYVHRTPSSLPPRACRRYTAYRTL